MIYQKVKYKLINNDTNTSIWLDTDPQNWDESERTLKRSDKTFGVYTELSKNLVFTKEAADFLKLAYAFKDIEADVTLQEHRYHPKTEIPYLHSTGVFDFSEYKEDRLTVKVPFKSGGLNALIKSQLREKFELERLDSIDGDVINEISKVDVALTSRKIFLVTSWESDNVNTQTGENGDQNTKISVETNIGETRGAVSGLPLNIVSQSHGGFAEYVISNAVGNSDGLAAGSASNMFFYNSDQERTLDIALNYDFDAWFQQYEDVGWCYFVLCLTTYENGANLDFKDRFFIHELRSSNTAGNGAIISEALLAPDFGGTRQYTIPVSGSYATSKNILAGESLSFELWLKSDMQTSNTAGVRVYVQDVKSTLQIQEDSYYKDSQTEAVLMHETGDKLMQIITGEQNRFYSEFYGREDLGYLTDGEYSRTALALGFWIRQFYYTIEVIDGKETPKYGMQMSIDNFLNTSNVIHNTGYTIETINGVETLVVEDMKYFFQDAIAITLPNQVSKLEREAYTSFCDSSLEFGYKQGGEYEEAMGLDEYNIKTGFTTPLKRVDTKYTKLSDARADSYAKEFARRKQIDSFPTTDTPYDKDLHLLDLKIGFGDALEERLWADDYEIEPTGVYSPETATNLRLTPSQLEQRHQWFYGAGLTKHQDKYIRYSNTDGNNSLTTKKTGETARGERDNILISDLERPRFVNQKITFEHPVDFYVNEQVFGKTNVNGRLIPNYFFKVEFINEYNKKETGYLMELKPNKEGKWTLLKAI